MTEAGWTDQGDGRFTYRPGKGGKVFGLDVAPFEGKFDPEQLTTATVTTLENRVVPSPDDESVNGMLRRLIFLKALLKTAEADAKAYKAEIKELDERIRLEWAEDNINSAGIDGKTAYLYPVYHVEKLEGATPEDIRTALVEAGLGYMLKENYSAQSLTAYLKELREHGDEPPAALAAVVKLVPSTEIRLRDSGSRTTAVPR